MELNFWNFTLMCVCVCHFKYVRTRQMIHLYDEAGLP